SCCLGHYSSLFGTRAPSLLCLPLERVKKKYDRTDGHSNSRNTFAFKESCSLQNRDIVEVVRTEYIYSRPPPWSDILPTIHIITPTYSRPVQKAELTRLANTLLHVVNLHWILVEDSQRRTSLVSHLLHNTGLNYTHLNVETPRNYKVRGDTRDPRIPRGTIQRNLALRWLRETFSVNTSQPGVVYFADDDNTYSLELFEEVRKFNLAFLIYDFMKHFSSEFMVSVASYKSYIYIRGATIFVSILNRSIQCFRFGT
uniref:Galactosylgalactosylxylosylprotein 3-beta-glucuronosyltransferase n=1 Tax=Haplochromis burtoni TaxID=8153 RepID=A0A3Q2WVJ7_HAPBU